LAAFVKRRIRAVIVPLLLLIVTGYFVFNAIKGSRGITAQRQDQALLAQDKTALTAVQARRDRWQARVDALRHHAIDPDMLNAQARSVLNLADPDDLSVPLKPSAVPQPPPPSAAAPGLPLPPPPANH
jgi:cell division protein FtsB